ncbi:VCBS repeat-containing protein [bacterium AH-315-K20]|nr:VCBS repeat-containing protein [bacterium AH-315-K20]
MARTLYLTALVLFVLTTTAARAQSPCKPWFKHQQVAKNFWGGIALIDLDPTGWLDLVGNTEQNGLEIWRFGTDGSVTLIETVDEQTGYTLLAADFDGDGDTDLVTGNTTSNTLHIYTNTNGTLLKLPGTHIPNLREIHAATDLDLDGLPELVVHASTEILIYKINADGTMTKWTSVPFDDLLDAVVPASINQDEHPDLLVVYWNRITPIRQNPDGTFEVLSSTRLSRASNTTLTGDINRDGLTDVLYDDRKVLLGQGQGEFAQGADLDERVSSLGTLTDLDHDGDLDLLVNARTPDDTAWSAYTMLNDGQGNFTFLEHNTIISSYSSAEYILVQDINRDGHLDLVSQRSGLTDLRMGFGDGSFDSVPFQPVFENHLRRATLGDIDADGDLDIIATGDDPDPAIKVLTNDGTGSFVIAAAMAAPSEVYERTPLFDFDGDGDLDILAWTLSHGLWIYKNTDDGFFSQVHVFPHREGGPAFVPLVSDINNNRRPDIVAGDAEGETRGYTVYLNRGNGEFLRRFSAAPTADHVLAIADFNNDGNMDLLCANTDENDDQLQICYGKRSGIFYDPVPIQILGDSTPYAMPGDFNGDGWQDFVIYGWVSRDVKVVINQRDGTFLHTETLEQLFAVRDPGVVDLDGDGFDELVCATQNTSGKSAIFSFNAAGRLLTERPYGNAAGNVLSTPVGDLNGDGATDILQVAWRRYRGNGCFSVFLNQCPGSPCFPDLDNDGDTDTDDFITFLTRWNTQRGSDCSGYDCTADLDKNGTVDSRDFVAYLNAWAAGC